MPLYLKFYFWLLCISAVVFVLERCFPWRRQQEVMRAGLVQDLFWMIFNTQYVSWIMALAAVHVVAWFNTAFLHLGAPTPDSFHLISHWPLALQFVVVFLVRDFLEWNIHRWLHTVPWLWRFHRLHHSIEELDWAASFRAHWGEMVLYKIVIYLPLVVLGVDDRVIFATIACSLLVQELSHANVRWDFGPLRYVLNSPRFHAWHHDVELHGKVGQNFGVTFIFWDWIFGTAHWPKNTESPQRYGLGDPSYPSDFWSRLWDPFRRALRPTVTSHPVPSENNKPPG